MAYCKNCGAYVPDGHTKCLACGLDQNEDKNKEYGSGSAAQTDPRQSSRPSQEEMRRQMEQQRKKQQEDSRRWAEAERQRRRQEQEEEARRRREAETEGTAAWSQTAGNAARSKSSQPNKLLAALSYLSVLFVLPFIFCKDDKFAMFHARQGAILFAITAVGEVLGSAFGLGWIVTLMHLYWIYKGMTNANDGKVEPLPYIGNLFSKQ